MSPLQSFEESHVPKAARSSLYFSASSSVCLRVRLSAASDQTNGGKDVAQLVIGTYSREHHAFPVSYGAHAKVLVRIHPGAIRIVCGDHAAFTVVINFRDDGED